MAEKIKVDVVSDVVCPWCIVGYKRLEKAISELGIEDKIELEWQPFELNPHMPPEGENIQEHLHKKYGAEPEDQKKSQDRLSQFGEELGFKFDYWDEMKIVNTRDAHILLDYAKEKGKQTELNLRLIESYFSERKDVSEKEVLEQALKEVGLNSQEAMARLESDDARYQVTSNENYWQSLGVSSVPTMVFDRKSALTGAQPVEVYKQVLTELLEEKTG
ncbi:DsbA family oxidoreductase [Zeaxanthinibacter enoshimensis]|uniref:Putative DsbA family dithiol-disulfide isomerase n=1 Tax=Zeaxanthinibacter enoshimensis TaxID=392009 RepID=A0A4R6TPI9_9FLAO|nr:DsbA family oxidoreductase [Zeaxanthinibacter enoshimensis]TDQ33050.1 putative DsbA family dithiol-disulfide isomerase [Zeaxanthinibacter enoshimensis]